MYFVTPDGRAAVYDKHHLFGYGGEKLRFEAGDRRVVVEYGGVRFLLAICYDLRFPVWLRNRGDYDVMLLVASWPRQRRNAWDVLARARAIENQCYVLAAHTTEAPWCWTRWAKPWHRSPTGKKDGAAPNSTWRS